MGANSKVCSKSQLSKDLASTEQRELFQMQLLGWSDRNALLAALAKPAIVSRQPAARTVSRPIDRLIPHHRGLEPLKEFKFYPYVDPGAYIIQYRRDCSSVSTPDGRQGPLEMFALIGGCAQDRQTVDVVDSENGPTETTVQLPSVSKGDENINGSSVSCATHFESLDTVSEPPLQNEPPLASCGMETAQADTIAEIHSPTVLSAPRSCGHTRAVRPTRRDNQFSESQLAHQKKPYGGLRYGASVAPAIVTKYTPNQKDVGKYLFLTGTNVAMRQNALRHDALMSLVLSTTANTSRTAEESCRKTRSSGLNKGLTATYLQPLVSRSHVAQPKLRRNCPGPKIKGGKVKDLTAPKQTNMSNSSLPLNVRDAADPNFAEVLFVKLLQVEQCQRRQNSLGALDIPKSEAASPLEQFERVHSSAIPADAMDTYQLGLRKSAERDSFNATVM
ncbi:unnamed protein product [Dicrocoelium dendriticum]|nr:unnamed protein product [Dicrocoelium dendriticum]